MKATLDEKPPERVNKKCTIFHLTNTRLQASLMTTQRLLKCGWEVLIHAQYLPNIVPLDFHLVQSLQNYFNGKTVNSLEDHKRHLQQFFAQK